MLTPQANTNETDNSSSSNNNQNILLAKFSGSTSHNRHINTKVTCSANSTLPGAMVYYTSHIILSCGLQVEP